MKNTIMAENNRFEQNKGAQQGNTAKPEDLGNRSNAGSTSTDPQKSRLQNVGSNEANMEDDIRPADARDMRDENMKIGLTSKADSDDTRKQEQPGTAPMTDKGDKGRQGSMREAFESEEGFRTMDEDENANDSLKKGDNSTQGNP
jgi:hypothetical protein